MEQADERRRSDARVAALAAAIHDGDLPLRAEPQRSGLFAAAQPARERSRVGSIVPLGVLVVASAAALVVVIRGEAGIAGAPGRAGTTRSVQAAPAQASAAPLELVALTQNLDADRLVVRGIVRNPDAGVLVTHLAAVVLVFNRDGAYATAAHGDVEVPLLAPGMETPFTVQLPAGGDAARYRVSFKADDRIVPHVDRRPEAVAAAPEVQQP